MSRLVQWVLAAALMLCATNSAHAIAEITPPTGWTEGRIYVGRDSNGFIWAIYKTNTFGSGTCTSHQIGSSGVLNERTRVHGGSWTDEVLVTHTGSVSVCGKTLIALGDGPKLELYTWGGTDFVDARGNNRNLQVYLGSGQDFAAVGDAYLLSGESGSDVLITISTSGVSMYGGAGFDLFCSYFSHVLPIPLMDGGSDSDARWGSAVIMTSIENVEPTTANCDFWLATIVGELSD